MRLPRPLSLEALVDSAERLRSAATRRRHPWTSPVREAPVFIVGSGRSGSTLTRRILCAGGEIHIPPETYVLPAILRTWARERHARWTEVVRLVLGHFEFHPEFDKFELCLQPLARELRDVAQERRSLATILDSFYRYHARERGLDAPRWGDKTPFNTRALPGIDRVFPDAQYVHVLRDGADVVGSYVKAGRYATLREAAGRWRDAVRAAERFGRRVPARVHELRYEDLVRDPPAVIQRVCEFLGLPYDPVMIDDLRVVEHLGDVGRMAHHENVKGPIGTGSIGKGRRDLSEEDRARLAPLIDRDLVQRGYAPLASSS